MVLRFDRSVSSALLGQLRQGGAFDRLLGAEERWPGLADVQLRRARGRICHASLYVGLTAVLSVYEHDGRFALGAHRSHRRAGGFEEGWSLPQPAEVWVERRAAVDAYLARLAEDRVAERWTAREGLVQAAVSAGTHLRYGPLQREAVPWADGAPSVVELARAVSDRQWKALQQVGEQMKWWPGVRDGGARPGMGTELDVLAVDGDGGLLCMEVKPAQALAGITWAPAQVGVYSELFAQWLDQGVAAAREALVAMAGQRAELGLLEDRWVGAPEGLERVVPVIAVGGWPASPQALGRLGRIAEALASSGRHRLVGPLQVWLLDPAGEPEMVWLPESEPVPSQRQPGEDAVAAEVSEIVGGVVGAGRLHEFRDQARRAAVEWKRTSPVLPDAARLPGGYPDMKGVFDFVLPDEYRELNLLPVSREAALSRFKAAGIHWHGDGEAPSPHLLDSQIQCLNALAPLVGRPQELARWLGSVLPVAEVLPFEAPTSSPYDRSDHVVFEWQGLVDHLGEWRGYPPVRGSMATSVDAAVRYRTPQGGIELALIEWKYTECYPYGGRLAGDAKSMTRRMVRYRKLVEDPDGPLDVSGQVDYEDLLAEPTYQLMRTQLLAWQIERSGELDVSRVVVVYAAPAANRALLQDSLGSPRFERFAASCGGLLSGWKALLRRPDRFVSVDTAELVTTASVAGDDFRHRYAHLASQAVPALPSGPELSAIDGRESLPERMSGDELQEMDFEQGVSSVWVGRQGGLRGPALGDDIATGAWRQHLYRVHVGHGPPNRNWFGADEFLERVTEHRIEAHRRAGWETVGAVIVDTASVAVAVPATARRLESIEALAGGADGIYVIVTMADADLPVEVRSVEGEVVEVRVDSVDDLEEHEGQWRVLGQLDVAHDGIVFYDAGRDPGPSSVTVRPGPGLWQVSLLEQPGPDLALRFTRQ